MIMVVALRFPRLWLMLGWCFVIAALTLSLLPAGTPSIGLINDKVAHAVGYAALTFWFACLYPRARYWLVAVGFLAMGVGVELAQGWMQWGRQCEFADVVADAIGVAVGVAIAVTPLGRWMHVTESWLAPRSRV